MESRDKIFLRKKYTFNDVQHRALHYLQLSIRSPFSTGKINYNENTGMVTYRSKMTHGKNKKNFSICTAEEFIAAITQHNPNPSFQMVRYVGWYSNRMRGDREKQKLEEKETETPDEDVEIIDVSSHKPRKIPPPTWRECIKKVRSLVPRLPGRLTH
ncbi:MAG: transposase [Desulfocapsa sp.]|nr:transposase [Desulfocapsa sp.]MBN4048552.1 transposase [bacterium AH-315-N22]